MRTNYINTILLLMITVSSAFTQPVTPEFYKNRRQAFRDLMPANSAAFIFAYPQRNFSADNYYNYHPNPDLYYLTGYTEPNSVLIIFKEIQGTGDSTYNEIFFVRGHDPYEEKWTGRRLGPDGTMDLLGFKNARDAREFSELAVDFNRFNVVIHDNIPADIEDNGSGYDLSGLYQTFKQKVPEPGDALLHNVKLYMKKYMNSQTLPRYVDFFKSQAEHNPAFANDPVVKLVLQNPDTSQTEIIRNSVNEPLWGPDWYQLITGSLREVKTPEELAVLKKAVDLTAIAHKEVMKAVHPGINESELEAIHTFVHRKLGGDECEGFPPIVGSGRNTCILHYMTNDRVIENGDLVLMDIGAQYKGYSGDITRTIPANGKFTSEQKEIYEIVYQAQNAVFKLCKAGNSFSDLYTASDQVLAKGLLDLGIISDLKDAPAFTLHNCSHPLGLDVHDKEAPDGILKENMVVTVEPGIYIPEGSHCDKKWWNIGIRIEDDVLIGKDGCEILSKIAPRSWQDVEKTIAEKSKFDDLGLPVIH
ncbi:MAG TPA: aminopeptidase P family protein [Bacteroidales bacterium]|nr:aminopeptidase P family protein [Bacteroidales bacterium]